MLPAVQSSLQPMLQLLQAVAITAVASRMYKVHFENLTEH